MIGICAADLPVARDQVAQCKRFLNIMERLTPWPELVSHLMRAMDKSPHAAFQGKAETLLRIYLLQRWLEVNPVEIVELLHQVETLRQFAHLPVARGGIPNSEEVEDFDLVVHAHHLDRLIDRY